MATPEQARRVVADLQPAEVDVVVTARAYCLQFPAIWQEALKMSYDGGFDQFMEEAFAGERRGAWGWSSQDLPAILRTWSDVVPTERIHVVTVPPPGARRELLWERWCQTLGIDDDGFDLDVSYPNESLGAPQAALLRRIKPKLSGPLLDGPTRHRWVRRYFGHEVLVPQAGPRFSTSPKYAEELHRRSREAIGAIRQGGYDVVGNLTDLDVEPPTVDGPHPDHVSSEEMLDVAARAIEQMIRDMREMTLQRNWWRERARRRWPMRRGAAAGRRGSGAGPGPAGAGHERHRASGGTQQLSVDDDRVYLPSTLDPERTYDILLNGNHVWSLHPRRDAETPARALRGSVAQGAAALPGRPGGRRPARSRGEDRPGHRTTRVRG